MRKGPDHEFVPLTGEYVFTVPGCGTLVLTEPQVEQIARSYTSWSGPGDTVDELARKWGRTRVQMAGILKSLGLTKSSLPLTPQQAAQPTDEVAEILVATDLGEAERSAHRRIWARTRRDAQKWRNLKRSLVDSVREASESLAGVYVPPERIVIPRRSNRRFALLYAPTDLHYGKQGWLDGYDLHECKRRLQCSTASLLSMLPATPDEIICPVGSDWFHVDNWQGATTRGTPQDMAALPSEIWEGGAQLALSMYDVLHAVAPLRFVLMAGNHDRMLSRCLMTVVQTHYQNAEGISFEGDSGPYQYLTYGSSLLGFHHGHGRSKAQELGPLMAKHRAEDWGRCAHRYWFTGNLHHEKCVEHGGVTLYQLPSLSGTDVWHETKGYTTSRPQLIAPLIDYEMGINCVLKVGVHT